ncbi:hypothetical protein [Streptomyces sp. NPDC095613]|uniref:hypothetical protein n=1 Tax=Streptomyces sp. NPDC095613 TaxID=3155540 RepID=UPI003332FCF4
MRGAVPVHVRGRRQVPAARGGPTRVPATRATAPGSRLRGRDLIGTLPLPLGVAGHEVSTVMVGLNGPRLPNEAARPRFPKDTV